MATVKQVLSQAKQTWPATAFEFYTLLAHVLNKTPTWLKTWPESALTTEEEHAFHHLCERRASGEPLAYILGQWGFWSFQLRVTPATLIPRPETEHLVEWILSQFDHSPRRVLDLGTGSGAIALALALERPQWQLTATDISPQALAIAKQNATALNLTNITWHEGNWFQALPINRSYDLIVSNPPYIDPLDPHLLGDGLPFEPATALVSAEQGIADLKTIIHHAIAYLATSGWLVIEHGYQQGPEVCQLFQQNKYQNITTLKDYGQQERFTYGQKRE